MLAKFLTLILSYLTERLSPRSQTQSLASFGLEKLRTLTIVLVSVVIGLICFAQAFSFLLEDMKTVYKEQRVFGFTEISLLPAGILAIVAAIIYLSLRKSVWGITPTEVKPIAADRPTADPITEALTLLVRDFIDERKQTREAKRNTATAEQPQEEPDRNPEMRLHDF